VRDLIDSQSFCSSLDKSLTLDHKITESLRIHVVDSPNFLVDHHLVIKARTLLEKISLAIGSWYLDPEVGAIVRLDLEDKMRFLSLEDQFLLRQMLYSKAECLIFLLETSLWHSRDFFGNIVPMILSQLRKLSWKRTFLKRVKKPQRKRGYNDHGSKAPSHRWLPKFDWSLTEAQNEKEKMELTQLQTLDYCRGLLGSL